MGTGGLRRTPQPPHCCSSSLPARAPSQKYSSSGPMAGGTTAGMVLTLPHPSGPCRVEALVCGTRLHQVLVAAHAGDPAAVDNHDPVGPHGGVQPVGDQDGGTPLEQHV